MLEMKAIFGVVSYKVLHSIHDTLSISLFSCPIYRMREALAVQKALMFGNSSPAMVTVVCSSCAQQHTLPRALRGTVVPYKANVPCKLNPTCRPEYHNNVWPGVRGKFQKGSEALLCTALHH